MTKTILPATREFLQKWNSAISESDRESILKLYLIKHYLNAEMRDFLEEVISVFDGNEKLVMLKLCRKILLQNPERVFEVDHEHYKAFRMEYDMAINNDISLDGVSWIDIELNYFESVKELKACAERGSPALEASKPMESKEVLKPLAPQPPMTKEQTLAYFKISPSTFDRWRKGGFPCDKVGKKFYTDRKIAEAWITTHKPKKIEFGKKASNN